MNRFAVIFAVAAACAGVNSAWAADGDEQVVTASRAATSPGSLSTASVAAPVQQLPLQDASTPAYDAAASAGPRPNLNLVHGSASFSVGTGGYSSAYVSAVMPVGDNGLLGIAVSQTNFGKNGGFYDHGYGGYGYGGYGRGWQRGGKQTSVAVGLDMSDGESVSVPAGCAPGFRDGDHYVEPVWVTKLHDKRKCDAATETSAQGQ